MNVSAAFEANTKTTEVVKPRMSTFDNPPEFAQTTAVFCPALGDHRFDAALAKFLAMRFGVIAAIGVDDFGLLKRAAADAANWWDSVNKREQLGDVVAVRAGQDCTDGDAIRIDEDVMLGTWSRAIRGVRTSFSPAPMSLPRKNESLAERLNSSKESQEDEQDDTGALHARIQAGSGAAGQGWSEHCGGGRDAGVPTQSISNWVKAEQDGKLGGAGTKSVSAEQMELSRLRAEVARLKMERDILKKACAYFAKEST